MWGKCGERKQKNPRRMRSTRVLCTRAEILLLLYIEVYIDLTA